MEYLILFLPLIGSIISGFFGKTIGDRLSQLITCILVSISALLSLFIFFKVVSSGYEFNKKNSVTAASGKNKFKFDIKEQGFAWIADTKIEFRMIKRMKKGSRIMITGYNQKGSQTIDHYSLLGFTKAYNATKKACS